MRMYKHYSKEGSPKRCRHCRNIHFTDDVKSVIGGSIAEVSITCKKCHNEIGYWAYGYYDPNYYKIKGFGDILKYVLFSY